MTHPHLIIQQLMTQADHLKAFSHVIEDVFLLQQGNVFWQALLDSWGSSDKATLQCIQELDYSFPKHV
jgi:hypothetical protein